MKYSFFLAMMMSSCVVYHPHNVDMPLLSTEGEVQVNAAASLSMPFLAEPAVNATVSFVPIEKLGTQLHAEFTEDGTYFLQGAAGTYFASGLRVLEAYLGYGYGHNKFDDVGERDKEGKYHSVSGHYSLLFSQVNYGWKGLASNVIDVGLGLKAGTLIPDWEVYYHDSDGTTLEETHADSHLLLQPQLMFRVGPEHVKFAINVGYAFLSKWPTENSYINYERLSISLGVNLRF